MPAINHPVHPATTHQGDKPYGCSNNVFSDGYWVNQRRYFPDGQYVMQPSFVVHKMSTGCRYDGSLADKRCAECNHRGSGEDYVKQVTAR